MSYLLKYTVWLQSIYTLITAAWPLIDIASFMEVSGYKTDIWLVKTVGMLLVPVSLCGFLYLVTGSDFRLLALLYGGTAAGFTVIDIYYVANNTISPVYLADAVLEILFLVCWIIILIPCAWKNQ